MRNEKREADEKRDEMIRFYLELSKGRERIKPDSYLCLSCKHYKPRKGECKKNKGLPWRRLYTRKRLHRNLHGV